MSGKKPRASVGGGWLSCGKCKLRMPRNFSGKHADSDCGIIYPCIKDKAVYTMLGKATASSKIQNLPFVKNNRLSSSTIFLPDEIIRESGFLSFSWALIQPFVSSGQEDNPDLPALPIAVKIWPIPESIQGVSSTTSAYTAMMTNEGFLANKLLQLNPSSGDATILCIQSLLINPASELEITTPVFPAVESVCLELENVERIDNSTFDTERFISTFKSWFRNRLITTGNQFQIRFYAEIVSFRIKDVKTKSIEQKERNLVDSMDSLSITRHSTKEQFSEIVDVTKVFVDYKSSNVSRDLNKLNQPQVTLQDVGGLDPVLKELCSTINFIFNTNIDVAKGILIHGHSGTGKTLLIEALSNHFNLHCFTYNEFRQMNSQSGRKEVKSSSNSLTTMFHDAVLKSPAVIVIENLDSLAPKSSNQNGQEKSSSFINTLLSLIPSISSFTKKVIILASATDVDGIESSLRSPKIFGKEIELPVPSVRERHDIIQKILKNINTSLNAQEIQEIASSTHGFVGADLKGLCNQAVQHAIQRCLSNKDSAGGDTLQQSWENVSIKLIDLVESLKTVKPSAVKSILVDVPNVRWNDIGGQDDLKFKLKQAIEWPLKHPEAFQRLGITPPKGILMYGPPGCSKTMIAKAIATESGLNFISVKGSELFSKWVGESEKAVRDVFRKARQVAPCVVFFDEIDSLGGERGSTSGSSNVHERVLAQLLVEIDGIEPLKDVTIVAATNRPDIIDQALLRPGRLDRIIYVPLPDAQTRNEILKIKFQKMPVDSSVDIMKIVNATEGYSGAELTAISHEAAMKALEEDIESKLIEERHIIEALNIIKPRISKQQILFYENYNKSHCSSSSK